MILADVVPVSPAPKTVPPRRYKKELAYAERVAAIKDIASFLVETEDARQSATAEKLAELMSEHLEDMRHDIFSENGSLPTKLIYPDRADPLSLAAVSPRLGLKDARSVADKLGFLILPFDFVKESIYTDDPAYPAISGFADNVPEGYDAYVLGPVDIYDVHKHLESTIDSTIYAAESIQQAFTAINLVMPLFRVHQAQLQQHESQIRQQQGDLNRLQSEFKNLMARVDQLAVQFELQQKRRLIEQAKEQERAKDRARALEARVRRLERVSAIEPLLLAIPEETDLIEGDGECIVGPCWGPDFDDIVFQIVGLKKIAGQRSKLAALTEKWGAFADQN